MAVAFCEISSPPRATVQQEESAGPPPADRCGLVIVKHRERINVVFHRTKQAAEKKEQPGGYMPNSTCAWVFDGGRNDGIHKNFYVVQHPEERCRVWVNMHNCKELAYSGQRKCFKGCGRPVPGAPTPAYPTCCARCSGPAGGHGSDCTANYERWHRDNPDTTTDVAELPQPAPPLPPPRPGWQGHPPPAPTAPPQPHTDARGHMPQGPPQGAPWVPPPGMPQGPPQGAPRAPGMPAAPAQRTDVRNDGVPLGPLRGMPLGPAQGAAQPPPQGMPQGPPQGAPQAQGSPLASQGMPQGPPQGAPPVPAGAAPQGLMPQGMPLGPPQGPPQGVPGQPLGMPQQPPRGTGRGTVP